MFWRNVLAGSEALYLGKARRLSGWSTRKASIYIQSHVYLMHIYIYIYMYIYMYMCVCVWVCVYIYTCDFGERGLSMEQVSVYYREGTKVAKSSSIRVEQGYNLHPNPWPLTPTLASFTTTGLTLGSLRPTTRNRVQALRFTTCGIFARCLKDTTGWIEYLLQLLCENGSTNKVSDFVEISKVWTDSCVAPFKGS